MEVVRSVKELVSLIPNDRQLCRLGSLKSVTNGCILVKILESHLFIFKDAHAQGKSRITCTVQEIVDLKSPLELDPAKIRLRLYKIYSQQFLDAKVVPGCFILLVDPIVADFIPKPYEIIQPDQASKVLHVITRKGEPTPKVTYISIDESASPRHPPIHRLPTNSELEDFCRSSNDFTPSNHSSDANQNNSNEPIITDSSQNQNATFTVHTKLTPRKKPSCLKQILSPAINKAPPIQKGASPIQKGASPAQKGEPPIQNYSTPWHMVTVADKENVLKKRKYVELKDCSEHKKFYNTWAVISSVQCLPRRHKSKIVAKLLIKDGSIRESLGMKFDIVSDRMDQIPSLEAGAVLRIHALVCEVFNGVADGRVYSGTHVTVFKGDEGCSIRAESTSSEQIQIEPSDRLMVEKLRRNFSLAQQKVAVEFRLIKEIMEPMTCHMVCRTIFFKKIKQDQFVLRVEDGTVSSTFSLEFSNIQQSQDQVYFGNDKPFIDIFITDPLIINRIKGSAVAPGSYNSIEYLVCEKDLGFQSQDLLQQESLVMYRMDSERGSSICVIDQGSEQSKPLRERMERLQAGNKVDILNSEVLPVNPTIAEVNVGAPTITEVNRSAGVNVGAPTIAEVNRSAGVNVGAPTIADVNRSAGVNVGANTYKPTPATHILLPAPADQKGESPVEKDIFLDNILESALLNVSYAPTLRDSTISEQSRMIAGPRPLSLVEDQQRLPKLAEVKQRQPPKQTVEENPQQQTANQKSYKRVVGSLLGSLNSSDTSSEIQNAQKLVESSSSGSPNQSNSVPSENSSESVSKNISSPFSNKQPSQIQNAQRIVEKFSSGSPNHSASSEYSRASLPHNMSSQSSIEQEEGQSSKLNANRQNRRELESPRLQKDRQSLTPENHISNKQNPLTSDLILDTSIPSGEVHPDVANNSLRSLGSEPRKGKKRSHDEFEGQESDILDPVLPPKRRKVSNSSKAESSCDSCYATPSSSPNRPTTYGSPPSNGDPQDWITDDEDDSKDCVTPCEDDKQDDATYSEDDATFSGSFRTPPQSITELAGQQQDKSQGGGPQHKDKSQGGGPQHKDKPPRSPSSRKVSDEVSVLTCSTSGLIDPAYRKTHVSKPSLQRPPSGNWRTTNSSIVTISDDSPFSDVDDVDDVEPPALPIRRRSGISVTSQEELEPFGDEGNHNDEHADDDHCFNPEENLYEARQLLRFVPEVPDGVDLQRLNCQQLQNCDAGTYLVLCKIVAYSLSDPDDDSELNYEQCINCNFLRVQRRVGGKERIICCPKRKMKKCKVLHFDLQIEDQSCSLPIKVLGELEDNVEIIVNKKTVAERAKSLVGSLGDLQVKVTRDQAGVRTIILVNTPQTTAWTRL